MRKFRNYLIPALAVAIIALAAFFVIYKKNDTVDNSAQNNINSYQECIDAGNPSMESYPAQCRTEDGKTFTQDIGNENELANFIRSENPRPDQTISSPLEITGEAVGNWFFEASFPAKLTDANGKELAVIPVTAQGEWMTTSFVPYKATMTFSTPTTPTGTLILQKDNPSGLPENDNELRIPVKFSQYNAEETTVKVFYNNLSLNAECEKTVATTRKVSTTPAIARAALDELIKGPTPSEKQNGYTTLINPDVKINSLTIDKGVATVDFSAELESNSGGSCRALGIRAQITETLKQFPTVQNVTITVNGNRDILQP